MNVSRAGDEESERKKFLISISCVSEDEREGERDVS
jgi:hypothetical protein